MPLAGIQCIEGLLTGSLAQDLLYFQLMKWYLLDMLQMFLCHKMQCCFWVPHTHFVLCCRHRPSSRPAADASHAKERSGHQSSRPDRAERERAERDSRAEHERNDREPRPARDLPSRTARLEASRGKATDKAAEPNLPPPPTQTATTLQVR